MFGLILIKKIFGVMIFWATWFILLTKSCLTKTVLPTNLAQVIVLLFKLTWHCRGAES